MDHLPIRFVEDVLRNLSTVWFLSNYKDLSGSFGGCACRMEKRGYREKIKITKGVLERYAKTYNLAPVKDFEHLCPKFSLSRTLIFRSSSGVIPEVNDNVASKLESFLSPTQPSWTHIRLVSNSLDEKWLQTLSCFKNLQCITLFVDINEAVLQLLENVLGQEQLVKLNVDNHNPDHVPLFCKFLRQKQFKCLDFWAFNQEVKDQIMTLASKNGEDYKGRFVAWRCFVAFPQSPFQNLGRVDAKRIRHKHDNFTVDYWEDATLQLSNEEFMNNVEQTIVRFN
ncbi:hypothetical protein L596_017509 [Steinernema carpocapsae]|uniref:DUF38 domain-containing protein n=1 Tax=Steinernema carpocapsae TaxID=34508 RepID=A0A4U5N2K8_STECR|nr:hypothetical protein L596_017509 [Steinernema carpocapsae]